ncbi:hypothetical protein [Dyadobacter sp. CY312]|uniref:hypothetical protein n=1 Tax=Dyadobacter sp. CY312 TaxID=2907303 RepID=UPI001F20EEC9|nr:hypothetical protein [Dyadobacter sp. CY312]MCE7044599.1 hypothetical protein [Dyadobacter sp. CY312]
MLANSVSTETPHINASAGEQLYFFENLIPFIEAVFLLQQTESEEILNLPSEKNSCGGRIRSSSPDKDSDESATDDPPLFGQNENSKLRKKHKKLKKHSIWYRERIHDPFQVIHDFFDASSLASFKANFYEVLKATSEDQFYQKGSPNEVLHYLERFESMINVAYLINGEELGIRFMNSKSDNRHLFQLNQKMSHTLLSTDQISDPQKVLASFFEYKSLKEWKEALIEINDFALSKHPAHEWGVWIDVLSVFVYSVKLAEALYLIGRTYKE